MALKRHTPEQVTKKIREVEVVSGLGRLCRRYWRDERDRMVQAVGLQLRSEADGAGRRSGVQQCD